MVLIGVDGSYCVYIESKGCVVQGSKKSRTLLHSLISFCASNKTSILFSILHFLQEQIMFVNLE